MAFNYENESSRLGVRLIGQEEFVPYTRSFLERGRNLSSTLYDVPSPDVAHYYQRPGSSAVLNTRVEEGDKLRKIEKFVAESRSISGFSQSRLHFKSHVAEIEGRLQAYVPTGNLSDTALSQQSIPRTERGRMREAGGRVDAYQVNLGLEITNPEIIREVQQIQRSLKRGHQAPRTKHFAAGSDARRDLSTRLRRAGKGDEVVLVSPYLDDMSVVRDIARAATAGANVTVIAAPGQKARDNPKTEQARQQARDFLAAAGVRVYTADESLLVHAKYAAIKDDAGADYIQIGSGNYTVASAENRTLDYMFAAGDSVLAAQLIAQTRQIKEGYGLRAVPKSTEFTVNKYDLGPLGALYRPAFQERGRLPRTYDKALGAETSRFGQLPYYPTAMPAQYFQMFQGRALPQVTVYQNVYSAFTREEAPQALKAMDAQLSDPGLGENLNRLFGLNLYTPGAGLGISALRGIGRLLDTVFGHYGYQQHRQAEQGLTRGTLGKLDETYYLDSEPQRGFFEQSFVFAGESIKSVGLSLASYFAVTHSWNVARSLIQDTGADYLFDPLAKDPLVKFARTQYTTPIVHQLVGRAEYLQDLAKGTTGESAFVSYFFEGLSEDLKMSRAVHGVIDALRDYSIISPDGQLREINEPILQKIKALDLFNYSQLDVLSKDPVFLQRMERAGVNLADVTTDNLLRQYVNSFVTAGAEGNEVYSAMLRKVSDSADLSRQLQQVGLTLDDYIEATPAFVEKLSPQVAGALKQRHSDALKNVGIDIAAGQISMRQIDLGVPTFGGLFGMMAGSRQAERAMFDSVTRPMLEYVAVVGSDQQRSFRKALRELSDQISAPPALEFVRQVGEGADTYYEYTRFSPVQYGYRRMESLAEAYENIAYFVPSNLLLWFKPIRDLLGVQSIAVAGSGESASAESALTSAERAARTVDLHQRLAGQSLKGLIGSGFKGLVATQTGIARKLQDFVRNPAASFTDAYNLLSDDFQLRVIEGRMRSTMRGALEKAAGETNQLIRTAEDNFNRRNNIAAALREVTEGLYSTSLNLEGELMAKLHMRHRSLSLSHLKDKPQLMVSGFKAVRDRRFGDARRAANEIFELRAFEEVDLGQRYASLIQQQERLAKKVERVDSIAEVPTAKSAPFQMFRRFMMGAGLFFAADYLIDRFFLQTPGADLLTQLAADAHLVDEDGDRVAQMRFEGRMPGYIKYPLALAGFAAGGIVFGETASKQTIVADAFKAMRPGLKVRDRLLAGAVDSVKPKDVVEKLESPMLARLLDEMPTHRVSRRFGMTGALAGMAASLFAGQTLFSTVAHVANNIMGRYKDGLSIGGMYAQFSTTLMNATAEAIEARATGPTTRMAQADIAMGVMLASEYQVSGSPTPSRGIYSYAYQLVTPMFQLALVQRHEASTGLTTIGAGFQFLPILGMGTTPMLPLSFKIRQRPDPAEGNAYQAIQRLKDRGLQVSPEAEALAQQAAPPNAFMQVVNYLATGGFGDALDYNPKSSLTQSLMFLGATGIVLDSARYISKRLPNSLAREIKQMGAFADVPYHGTRMLNKLVEFSQIPLFIIPDTISKGVQAFGQTGPSYSAGLKGGGRMLGAALAFFAAQQLARETISAGAQLGANLLGKPDALLSPQTQTAVNLLAFPVALGAAVAAHRSIGALQPNSQLIRNLPSFARKAAPYYISYLVTQAIVSPDSQVTEGIESPATRAYTNLTIAGAYGFMLDRAGVFRRYDDPMMSKLLRDPMLGSQVKRLRASVIPAAAESGMRDAVQQAKSFARESVRATLMPDSAGEVAFDSAARSRVREIYRSQLDDILRGSTRNVPLLKSIGARMGLAARVLFTARLAATAITALAPNPLRAHPLMAPFRVISGVEPYQDEAQPARDPLAIMLGKYRPRNVREAFGAMLDFVGQSLTFGRFSPGQSMGLFKDQPNMFVPLLAGAGVTVGSNDQLRNYTQAQGASVDVSLAVYTMFRGELSQDLAFRLQSVLAAKPDANLSQLLSYYRGSFARRDPAQTSRFLVGSQTDAAKGSRGLMLAQRVRNLTMTNLANQRPSEIAFDFMRMMVAAGYAADENVDLRRVAGLPINYLGSLMFFTDSKATRGSNFVQSILGGEVPPSLTEYVISNALSNNIQLGNQVPILGDFAEAFAIASHAHSSPDPSTQFMHAVTMASIAVPSALMLGMTGAELSAAFVAMSKGGSQNMAKRELDDTLSRIRGRYIYNKELQQHGAKHRFSTGLSGFVDVEVSAVQSQQARAQELFFVMERQDTTRAARIDLRNLDLDRSNQEKLASLFNRQYIGNRETPGVLSSINAFVSSETGVDVHAYIDRHRNARRAAEELYEDFTANVFERLRLGISNTNVSLVNVFGFDSYDHLMSTILDRQSFIDDVAYLYDPHDLLRTNQYKPRDLVERSVFVRKYLANQAEQALDKLEGSLPHYSQDQLEDIMGSPGALTKLRQQLNSAQLEGSGQEVTRIRRTADEVAQSSAADLIRKQGVVATVRDTVTGLGSTFLKLTQLSEVFSMAEAISMLGSDKLVERRMASYAVSTYALEMPLALGGLAALQFAMANPLIAIGVAAIGMGIYAHSTAHPEGVFAKVGSALRSFERGLVDRMASLTYAVASMPVVQPILETITRPLRAVLHDVIAPTFTSMRLGARENRVLSYLTEFFVPETLDTFVDRPRFASEGYTYTGPIRELYTPSEIRRATRNQLANRRARITSLDAAPELLAPIVEGRAMGYREQLMQEKYFSGTTLSAFSSGSSYYLSDSLNLAISRQQAILDMTVYGRYTQRPDEAFPALGGDVALMNAAFKANRVGGGSPFALNKVIEEMRAVFGTPIFRGLGKVFSLMLDYTDALKNKAMDLLDFRSSNPRGDVGERIFKSLSTRATRAVSGIYNSLEKDAPKMAAMISGVYNRGIWQVLKTMGPQGFVMNTLGAAGELARMAGRQLVTRLPQKPRNLVHKMGGFFTPEVNLLRQRDTRLTNIINRFRKPTAGDYVKGSIGVMIGSSIGSSLGAVIGGETFGQLGAIAGTVIGSAVGVAAMYPVTSAKNLADVAAMADNAFGRMPGLRSLPQRTTELGAIAIDMSSMEGLRIRDLASRFAVGPKAQRFADTVEQFASKASAVRSAAVTRSRQLSSAAVTKVMRSTANFRRTAAKLAPAVVDGLPAVVDIANLTSTGIRVLSLKGTDARRDYDAAYKGVAEAAVTIGASSIGAAVMRGRFAPLKVIALAGLAKDLIGKPLGEALSELAYGSLLENNQGKRYYERRKRQGASAVDVIAGVAVATAVTAVGLEFATTDTGRRALGFGARQLTRTPQGAAVLMRGAQATEGILSSYRATRTSLLSRFASSAERLPLRTPGVTAPAVQAPAAMSRLGQAAGGLRSRLGALAGKATNILGYAALFAMPVFSAISQLGALARMTGDNYNRRDLREDYQKAFANPMREGLGLLGGALGSTLGPIGTLVGGIAGSVAGDIIGQQMSARNYRRAYEAGQTSRGDIKALGRATTAGTLMGAAAGLAVGVGALALGVVSVAGLPVLAAAALGAMVIGGATMIGSAVGAQLGFDTELHRRTQRENPGRRSRQKGAGSPAEQSYNYRDKLRESRSAATLATPAVDSPAEIRGRRRSVRAIEQTSEKSPQIRTLSRTPRSATVATRDLTPQPANSALPPLRYVAATREEVEQDQKRRLAALNDRVILGKRQQQSYDSGLSATQLRMTDAPEPWWKRLLEAPSRMLDAIKDAAAGAFKGLQEFVSGIGDWVKRAVEAVNTPPGSEGSANPLVKKVEDRIQSTNAELFKAVGMTPPTVAGLNMGDSKVRAVVEVAQRLGVDPIQLAAVISWESAGTFSPGIYGGDGDNYMGLIQFGPAERAQYGAHAGQTFEEQLRGPVVRYLEDRGYRPGMGITRLYTTILYGNPGEGGEHVPDSNGTTAAGATWRFLPGGDHYENARRFLGVSDTAPAQGAQGARVTGAINISEILSTMRGDMNVTRETVEGIRQQQAAGGPAGTFRTGLYTGPAHAIGGSTEYHIDVKFYNSLSIEQQVSYMDTIARGYRAQGRDVQFSNAGVHGEIYNPDASFDERASMLRRAQSAHSHSLYGDKTSIDFYIPHSGRGVHHESVEGAEFLMPVVPGGRVEYHSGGGGGSGLTIYDASGNPILQTFHGDIRRELPSGRSFGAQEAASENNANGRMSQASYNQAYQRAMGTMDGSHFIGARFEQIILERLREAGIPQSRLNEVKAEIAKFNEALPAEERQRAQQMIRQGQDPNYLDQLPVDNLFDARDAAAAGRLPEEVKNNARPPREREQALNDGERENIHAAARQVDPEIARTTRQREAYSMANAAVETRQAVEERSAAQVTISRRRHSHPDDQIALAEPGQRAPQHTQQEVQRVAYAETRRDGQGGMYTQLVVEDFATEADRSAVMANDGRRIPDAQLAMAEPMLG